jgi:hypothetical protein
MEVRIAGGRTGFKTLRAGLFAAWGGLRFALASGGALSTASVAALAATLRDFWSYDARTNRFAVAERQRRVALAELVGRSIESAG